MNNYYSFVGGNEGVWEVTSCEAVVGGPLEKVKKTEYGERTCGISH